MIPVVGSEKNRIVIGEYSTFTEQRYPINSFHLFFLLLHHKGKSIMYTVGLSWRSRIWSCTTGIEGERAPQDQEPSRTGHPISLSGLEFSQRSKIPPYKTAPGYSTHSGWQRDRRPPDDPGLLFLHQRNIGPQEHLHTLSGSGQRGLGGHAVLPKRSHGQAKAMGHQASPRTEATSDVWDRPTLLYRLSCPGYFTAEPETVPSAELDSRDELTCSSKHDHR